MKLNKYLILAILVLSSIPMMAQARFSLEHELSKDKKTSVSKPVETQALKPVQPLQSTQSTHVTKKQTKKQIDKRCRIGNPRIKCWSRFANKKGNVYAQYMLGKFLYDGNFVHRNRRQAVSYFTKASYNNSAKAQIMLARMFQKGQGGLQRNKIHALAWYMVSTKNHSNNHTFVNKVRRLRRNLTNQMSRHSINKAKKLARRLESQIK